MNRSRASSLQASERTLHAEYECERQSVQHVAISLCIGSRADRTGRSLTLTSRGLQRQQVGKLSPGHRRILRVHIEANLPGPIRISDLAQPVHDSGRDTHYCVPPAQIRAGPI